MLRLRYTPPEVLKLAEQALAKPVPYCQRNAWAYKEWLDLRNAIANEILRRLP